MAIAMTEEMSASLHRGLSEWWNEETEYVFQRIERWAAIARGYNRLRSERLSRGRLTMQEEQEPRWTISANRIVIDDPNWSPRFHNLRRSHRRKSRADENCRINCCGTFNYQSSCNLDSNCLENYRYDHSIYFKTIGDIKSSKRDVSTSSRSNNEDDNEETSGDECIEWEMKGTNIFDHRCESDVPDNGGTNDNADLRICINDLTYDGTAIDRNEDQERRRGKVQNVWPIVDLEKLSLDADNHHSVDLSENVRCNDRSNVSNDAAINRDDNNNCNETGPVSVEKMTQLQIDELTANLTRRDSAIESIGENGTSPRKNHSAIVRITSARRSRRMTRKVRQPVVVGDNNVLWPGVLLNYTKNVDNTSLSPHHYRAPVKVK